MNRAIFRTIPIYRFLSLLGLLTASTLSAQSLQVINAGTAPFTPENLISNIFLGNGVSVSSITFNGKPVSVGYFSGGQSAVGLNRGIILTTGRVETGNPFLLEFGCNETGSIFANNALGGVLPESDPDLSPLVNKDLHDITSYVITFVPISDTLRFRYCFASEEYPTYSCSDFNDIFGFFIQGPGYPTPTNIALIPGTSLPVAINNIHPDYADTCKALNLQYYIDNNNSNKQPTYNGLTQVFTAEAVVTPCETYTIKLAIADVGDNGYDSGVFLEAKSFGTGALQVDLATPSLDGTITEGCSGGALTLRLPVAATADFPIDYTILGTAQNGVDVQAIPSNLVIPAGQTEITIPIIAIEDNIADANEYIALDVQRDPCHRDTIKIFIRDNTLAPPILPPDTAFCSGGPALTLNGTLPVQSPPPPTFSNTQALSITPLNTAVISAINVFGVQPAILQPGMIRSVCLDINHGWVDDLDVYLISPGGQFLELMTDCGGNGKNYTNTCFTPKATKPIALATALEAPFQGSWQPEGLWSDLWSGGAAPVNGTWQLQLKDDQNGVVGTLLDWTITFEPLYALDYQWSPTAGLSCANCPAPAASPSNTTQYTVHAVDTYGCTIVDSVQVKVLPTPEAPVVLCGAYTSNSIIFDWLPVPGAASYEVNINGMGWVAANGVNAHQVTGLSPGETVSLQVRGVGVNAMLCPGKIDTAICSNCQPATVTKVIKNETCAGIGNGSVTLTPDNLNPPYTFQVGTQTNTTGIFTNLPAGNYVATVTDKSGCPTLVPFVVGGAGALNVTITAKNITCFNGDDGTATATATGGTAILTYKWSDPANQTAQKAVNLKAGTYTVTVTDSNGCSGTASVTLTQPPDMLLFITTAPAKCFGDSSGTANVVVSGGASPYQFAWSNGQQGPNATNLKAGSYLVTVTDAIGCAKTSFALIGQAPQITASTSTTAATCNGLTNGSAIITAQGGSGNLSYKWSDPAGQTTVKASNLAAGTYTVTVTDANGCTITRTAIVDGPPAIQLTLSGVNIACHGNASGTAMATASGGTGTLSYLWNDPAGQSTPTASMLPAGNYSVTVTDASGCTVSGNISLTEPAAISVSTTVQQITCYGASNGQIALTAQGGQAPLTYKWSSGEINATITNKTAGTYTFTVTDANGCTATGSEILAQPTELIASATGQSIQCFGDASGTIVTTVTGGTGATTITWKGPGAFTSNSLSLNNLFAGNYSATISDASGCTKSVTVVLDQPSAPLLANLPDFGDTICFGASNGAASAMVTGGTAPYQFLWNVNNQTGPAISGLSSALYRVTVTDANNCQVADSIFIPQKQQMFAWAESGTVDCFGSNDGTARVTLVFYGVTPADLTDFTYYWNTNPPQSTVQATGLNAGQTYTVTVTDQLGCTATQMVSINNVPALGAAIVASRDPSCSGGSDGWAIATGSGGNQPYMYAWSPNVASSIDSLAQNLAAGTYRVTATDAKGCTGTASVTLGQPAPLKISFQATPAACFGDANGKAKALGSGGTPDYQFVWSTGAATDEIQQLPAGIYQVTLTDHNGCTLSDSIEIKQPGTLLSGTTVKQDVGCFGGYTGRIQITGTGGAPPYRYALNADTFNGSSVQFGLPAGVYTPHIIDKNGCTAELAPVEITQRPAIELDLGPTIHIELGESTQLFANVLNAAAPVTYIWNPGDSLWLSCLNCPDPFVDSLENSTWFVLNLVDSFGCQATARVQVVVEKPRKVFVPTAFSPNADGTNDLLLVHGQASTRVVSFQVYDRWGEMLYEGGDFPLNDQSSGWDGTFRGKAVNPGVYVWVLEVEYRDGVRDVYRGQTTLIR